MKVSVVIPCHNAERYLAQTLHSILAQTVPPAEIIVVDDASTDGSAAVARAFGEPVRVVATQDHNAAKARNRGYSAVCGDAVMFLDAHDVLGPDTLASLTDAVGRHPAAIALCPWSRLMWANDRWVCRPPAWPQRAAGHDDLSNWLLGRHDPPCAVLWPREVYQHVGGWDERVTVHDHSDLILRALILGIPFNRIRNGEVLCRLLPPGEPSISRSPWSRQSLESGFYMLEKIAALLRDQGALTCYHQGLEYAFGQLAAESLSVYPDLNERCLRHQRRYRGRWWPARRAYDWTRCRKGRSLQFAPIARAKIAPLVEERNTGIQGLASTFHPKAVPMGARSDPHRDVSPTPVEVSVIVPCFNRAQLIGRALDSVLDQSFTNYELLVVDDGSSDGTADVVQRYMAIDSRVRYLFQSNRGVSAARNRGMRSANGEFLAFLDSDDQWFPHKLERQIQFLRAAPENIGLVYCGVETVNERDQSWIFAPEHRGNVHKRLLLKNVIHTGSGVVIRRNVMRAAGFFDEDIPAIEDYDYWLRIARFYEFDYVDEPLLRYFDPRIPTRKSCDPAANLAARAWFFRKHQQEMRAAGVAHRFLQESAARHRVPGYNHRQAALRLELQAALLNPLSRNGWRPLYRNAVPAPIRGAVGMLRRARQRLRMVGAMPRK